MVLITAFNIVVMTKEHYHRIHIWVTTNGIIIQNKLLLIYREYNQICLRVYNNETGYII